MTLKEQIQADKLAGLQISTGDGALPSTFLKDKDYVGKITSPTYTRTVREGTVTYKLPATTPKVGEKTGQKFKLPLDTEMVAAVEGGADLTGKIISFTVGGFTPDGEEKERLYINRSTYSEVVPKGAKKEEEIPVPEEEQEFA